MRYHLTLVRMAKNNNLGNNRCWQGCGERGTLSHCWWECKLVQPLQKTIWGFLKKLKKKKATLQPSNYNYLSTCNLIYSSNVHNSQTVEGASVSIERWMDKEDVVYVYNGILLSHYKRRIPTICFNVDGPEGIMLSEVCQSEKEKYYLVSFIWGI